MDSLEEGEENRKIEQTLRLDRRRNKQNKQKKMEIAVVSNMASGEEGLAQQYTFSCPIDEKTRNHGDGRLPCSGYELSHMNPTGARSNYDLHTLGENA